MWRGSARSCSASPCRVRACAPWPSVGLPERSFTSCSVHPMEHRRSTTSGSHCVRSASTQWSRASRSRSGVVVARAHTPDGTELDVHLHGRDSWDSQFFVKMWRLRLLPFRWTQRHGESTTPGRTPGLPDAVRSTRGRARDSARDRRHRPARRRPVRGRTRRPAHSARTASRSTTRWSRAAGSPSPCSTKPASATAGSRPAHLPASMPTAFTSASSTGRTIDWDQNSRRLDEAQLLTTTAVVVGADRAIAAARRRPRGREPHHHHNLRATRGDAPRAAPAGPRRRPRHR